MDCGWVSAILWFSVELYGYLIVHHALQACLGQQRLTNLRMIGFLLASFTFSIIDSFLYQPQPTPPTHAYWLTVGVIADTGPGMPPRCASTFLNALLPPSKAALASA